MREWDTIVISCKRLIGVVGHSFAQDAEIQHAQKGITTADIGIEETQRFFPGSPVSIERRPRSGGLSCIDTLISTGLSIRGLPYEPGTPTIAVDQPNTALASRWATPYRTTWLTHEDRLAQRLGIEPVSRRMRL